jgi:hypothetical protein
LPPGMNHLVYADGETEIQINTVGPWDLEYVNPEDDPRKRIREGAFGSSRRGGSKRLPLFYCGVSLSHVARQFRR